MRHHSAAAPWSSGSGRAAAAVWQQVVGVDAAAVEGGEPAGEDGQERVVGGGCVRRRGWPVPIP